MYGTVLCSVHLLCTCSQQQHASSSMGLHSPTAIPVRLEKAKQPAILEVKEDGEIVKMEFLHDCTTRQSRLHQRSLVLF